jgi:hypothetical protein
MNAAPICRIITVHTFRGDRTRAFGQRVFGALNDERNGRGPGPSRIDCLLFAGHTGVSTNANGVIYDFNPNGGPDPIWQVMQRLRSGDAYPGVVLDDTAVFTTAQQHGLIVLSFDNCTTWIERLGLPLLTGRMDEFTAVTGVAGQVRRRFGVCI